MASAITRIIEEMQTARLVSIRERGVIATCVEGRIWLTRDGNRNENVLEAGESFTTADRNRVILQALSASRVFLDYPAKRDAFSSIREVWRRLQAFAAADTRQSAWRSR
jgi:hypothetical protein